MSGDFDSIYKRSLNDPVEFWREAAESIDWERECDSVLSKDEHGAAIWFAGAEANTCWNALDRHVATGRGAQTALIYDSPVAQVMVLAEAIVS